MDLGGDLLSPWGNSVEVLLCEILMVDLAAAYSLFCILLHLEERHLIELLTLCLS